MLGFRKFHLFRIFCLEERKKKSFANNLHCPPDVCDIFSHSGFIHPSGLTDLLKVARSSSGLHFKVFWCKLSACHTAVSLRERVLSGVFFYARPAEAYLFEHNGALNSGRAERGGLSARICPRHPLSAECERPVIFSRRSKREGRRGRKWFRWENKGAEKERKGWRGRKWWQWVPHRTTGGVFIFYNQSIYNFSFLNIYILKASDSHTHKQQRVKSLRCADPVCGSVGHALRAEWPTRRSSWREAATPGVLSCRCVFHRASRSRSHTLCFHSFPRCQTLPRFWELLLFVRGCLWSERRPQERISTQRPRCSPSSSGGSHNGHKRACVSRWAGVFRQLLLEDVASLSTDIQSVCTHIEDSLL